MANKGNILEYEVNLKSNDKDVVNSLNKIQNSLEKVEKGVAETFSSLTGSTGTLNKSLQSIGKSLETLNKHFEKGIDVSKIKTAVSQLGTAKDQIDNIVSKSEKTTGTLNIGGIPKLNNNFEKTIVNAQKELEKLKTTGHETSKEYQNLNQIINNATKYKNVNQPVLNTGNIKGIERYIQNVNNLTNHLDKATIRAKALNQTLNSKNTEKLSTQYQNLAQQIQNFLNLDKNSKQIVSDSQISNLNALFERISTSTQQSHKELNNIKNDFENLKNSIRTTYKEYSNIPNIEDKLKQQIANAQRTLSSIQNVGGGAYLSPEYSKLSQSLKNTQGYVGLGNVVQQVGDSQDIAKYTESVKQLQRELTNADLQAKVFLNNFKNTESIVNLDSKIKNLKQSMIDFKNTNTSAFSNQNIANQYNQIINTLNNGSIKSAKNIRTLQQEFENIKSQVNSIDVAERSFEKLTKTIEFLKAEMAKINGTNIVSPSTLTSINFLKKTMEELKKSFSKNGKLNVNLNSQEIQNFTNKTKLLITEYNNLIAVENREKSISNTNDRKTKQIDEAIKKYQQLEKVIRQLGVEADRVKKTNNVDISWYDRLNHFRDVVVGQKNQFTSNGAFNLNTSSSQKEINNFLNVVRQTSIEYNKLMTELAGAKGLSANNDAAQKLVTKYAELAVNLRTFANVNSKMGSDKAIMAEYNRIMRELSNNTGLTSNSFIRLKGQVAALKREVYQKGLTGRSLSEELSYIFDKIGIKAMLGTAAYRTIGIVKEMVENVKELDTAMTTLKRVTSETSGYYKDFFESAKYDAANIGTTVKDLISSTSDFSRAGFSNIDDAYLLAQNASIYSNVGFLDMAESTEHLTSVLNAFQISAQDSINVIDKFDKIGNEFSITSAGIGEALERSGSALVTANNSLDKSIALITAGNTIVQDPSSVANGIRTIALRLRGAKAELEEMGEDTDGLATSSAKLQNVIASLTGVNILQDNGDFKDTYEILREISLVYDKLDDKSQATVLETIAGKNRANVAAAILTRFDIAEAAYEASLNSSGTATKEMEVLAESTEFKLKQLESTYQSLSESLINTDAVKNVISVFTDLLVGATKLFDKLGEFPSIVAIITAGLTALKSEIGFVKLVDSDGKGLLGTGQNIQLSGFDITGQKKVDNDKKNLKNYTDQLKQGVDAGQAFENTMSNSSKTAKEMAQNLGESVKNIEDATRRGNLLDNGLAEVNRQLDSMTLKAKLASFAVNTLKTVLNMAANVAITWAVTKGFELLVNYINREKNAIEETKENIQNLKSTLEDNQDKISDITQQLEENKQKISEINASPLSITQAEDLDNLKMQNLELENQLELLKLINERQKENLQEEVIKSLEQKSEKSYSNGKKITVIDSVYDGMNEVRNWKERQKELLSAGMFSSSEGNFQKVNDEILNINKALSENITYLVEQQQNLDEGSYYYNVISDAIKDYENYLKEISQLDYISNLTDEIAELERQTNISGIFDSNVIESYLSGNYFQITGEILPEFVIDTDSYDEEIAKLVENLTSANGIFKQENISNQILEVLDSKMIKGTLSETEKQLYEWIKFVQEDFSGALKNIGGINKLDTQQQEIVDEYFYMLEKIQAAMYLEDYISDNNVSLSTLGTEEFNTFRKNFLNAAKESGFSQELAEEVFKGIADINIAEAELLQNPPKEMFNLGDYEEQIDALQEQFGTLQSALQSIFSDSWTESDKVDFLQKFPNLAPYADDIDTLKYKITQLLNETPNGLVSELESLKNVIREEDIPAIEALIDKLKDITIDVKFDTLTENINTAESELQKLNAYIKTNNSDEDFFDNSSLYEMLQLYPELKDKVLQTARGYKIEQGALEDVKKTRLNTLQEGLQQELDNAKAVVGTVKQKLQGYGIEIEGINAVNDAKLKQAELEAQILQMQTEMLSANGSISAAQYISTQQAIQTLQEFIAANGKVSDTQNQIDALQLQINQLGTDFSAVDDEVDKINDDLDDTKDAIQDQIDAMEDMVDKLEDQLDDIDDASDSIKDLIDLTVEMIKKQKELEKEALNDELDRINKIIEGRKEQLKIEKEAYDYNKSLNEKTADVNSIQTQLETLSNDDSMEAMKKRLELEQELKDAQSELEDFQYDHRIDLEEAALDKEKEYYEEFYNEKIKAIDDYLDKEGVIRSDAIALINGKTQEFYNDLLYYTQTYTDMAEFEFNDLWNKAYAALELYGNGQIDVLATLQLLSVQAGMLQAQIDGYNMSIQALNNTLSVLESQATAAANALQTMNDAKNAIMSGTSVSFEKSNTNTENLKRQLDTEREKLAKLNEELQVLYNHSNYDPNFTKEDNKKIDVKRQQVKDQQELVNRLEEELRESTYHSGGLVRANNFDVLPTSLKSNEVFAKLMAGEIVVTEKQAENFMSHTLPKLSSNNTITNIKDTPQGINIDIGDTIIEGNADENTINQIKQLQKQWSNDIFKQINKSVKTNGGGRNTKNVF